MTTRADLEREREVLDGIRWVFGDTLSTARHAALTASIARLDALLNLSDTQCAYLVRHGEAIAEMDESDMVDEDDDVSYAESASAHRTVADLVRRTS